MSCHDASKSNHSITLVIYSVNCQRFKTKTNLVISSSWVYCWEYSCRLRNHWDLMGRRDSERSVARIHVRQDSSRLGNDWDTLHHLERLKRWVPWTLLWKIHPLSLDSLHHLVQLVQHLTSQYLRQTEESSQWKDPWCLLFLLEGLVLPDFSLPRPSFSSFGGHDQQHCEIPETFSSTALRCVCRAQPPEWNLSSQAVLPNINSHESNYVSPRNHSLTSSSMVQFRYLLSPKYNNYRVFNWIGFGSCGSRE